MNPLAGGIPRFFRYNLVGAMGLSVKFSVLTALVEFAGAGYLASTAVAVEAAMIHNFTWHLQWTWSDRSAGLSRREALMRLLRFHLGAGAVAMLANLLVTRFLVQEFGIHYAAANLAATVFAGLANFMISNFVVFTAAESSGHGLAVGMTLASRVETRKRWGTYFNGEEMDHERNIAQLGFAGSRHNAAGRRGGSEPFLGEAGGVGDRGEERGGEADELRPGGG